ncbi:MAG: hypothetical protein FWB94_04865 [Chitinispirillia bacterium]|nr:hypothetical protein [Chitinispirillia bacterium]
MKKTYFTAIMVLTAALLLSPLPARSQGQGMLPSWIDDARRAAAYPAAEWYVGYSVGSIGPNDKQEEVRKRVEREAQNKLAEGISVRIQATSTAHTQSAQTRTGANVGETIRKDYGQIIQATTNAELARVEVISFHDQATNRIHALARAKKSDLAAYYVSRIEFYLQRAENEFKLAQQHASTDRKRSALERIEESKRNIEESGNHYDLLVAVDFKGDVKRLLDQTAQLRKSIAALETSLGESASVFITGKETIGNSEVDIVIPALQTIFSQSGCRVADSKESAQYVLTIDVRDHMTSQDKNFSYCYAQVRASLLNAKTGKTDANLNFTGPKASWTSMERACQNALNEASRVLWREISTKTEVCR